MGDNERLLSELEKLANKYPNNLVIGYDYAKQLMEKKEYRIALESFEQLIEKHPIEQIPVALIGNWQELMKKFGRNEEVLRWLEKQHKVYPNSTLTKWLLAISYIEILEYNKARKLLLEAHALKPENPDFLYTLAYIYFTMGQKKEAFDYYMKSLKLKPLQPNALRVASTMHKFTYGDTLFTYLNQAAAYLPDLKMEERAEIYNALGNAFESVGEPDTAFVYYEKFGYCHSFGKPNDRS